MDQKQQPKWYTLMPAFEPEEAKHIIESLSKERNDIVKLIRSINGAITNILGSEEELRACIDVSFEQFIKVTSNFYNDIINEKEGNIWKENFVKYVNLFFELLRIKKIYNTCPKDSFRDFYETSQNDQLLKIILPYERNLPTFSFTSWGSCHNFSILFKDYFDKLWIPSNIVFCYPYSNHSFVLCKIFEKYYILDTLLKPGKEPLFEVKEWDEVHAGIHTNVWISRIGEDLSLKVKKISTHHYEDDYPTKELYSFKTIEPFVEKLDNRKIKYIIVWYTLTDGKEFQIEFSRENSLGNIEFNFYYGNKTNFPLYQFSIAYHKIRRFINEIPKEEMENLSVFDIFQKIFNRFSILREFRDDNLIKENFYEVSRLINKQNVLDFIWYNV